MESAFFFFTHKVDGFSRRDGGNSMLVHHLLLAQHIEHHRKIIKALYITFNLKAVDQMNGHADIFFSHLIEERIL